jgi:hypothetical protein
VSRQEPTNPPDERLADNPQPVAHTKLHALDIGLAEHSGVSDRASTLIHFIEKILHPVWLPKQILEMLPAIGDDVRQDRKVNECGGLLPG